MGRWQQACVGNGCKHRGNQANSRWGYFGSFRLTLVPLWGTAVPWTPRSLLLRRMIPAFAWAPAVLPSWSFRVIRRRPGRSRGTGRFWLLPLMAKSTLTTSIASALFPKLTWLLFLFFSFLSLDGDLPLSEGGLDWLLSFFGGGFSCLYAQESLVHVPLFHLTQCPFGMYPVFSPTAGAALDEEAPRVLATRSRLDSRRSLSKYYGAPIDL